MNESSVIEWYKTGWKLFSSHWQRFILFSLLAFLTAEAAGAIVYVLVRSEWQFVSYIATMSIFPPFVCSFYLIFFKEGPEDHPPAFRDLFSGFSYFIQANIASLIILSATLLGTALFILPGLLVSALTIFTLPVIVTKKAGVLHAVNISMRLTSRQRLAFLVFGCMNILIMIGGAITVLGTVVVLPWLTASVASAYRQVRAEGGPV